MTTLDIILLTSTFFICAGTIGAMLYLVLKQKNKINEFKKLHKVA